MWRLWEFVGRLVFKPWLWTFAQYRPRPLVVPRAYHATASAPVLPSIAIVTPAYNHAEFLKATIDSVLQQNYPQLEYIVKDAGSLDGTRTVLEGYGARVNWLSESDTGQTNAINTGFRHISGGIMGWLNSDDLLLPGTLHYVASFFVANPDVDLVYGDRIIIDREGSETGRVVLPPHNADVLRRLDYIPQETMFWRRRVWEALGGLDENFQFAMDWDFLLRAQGQGFRFKHLPRFLGAFRVYPAQKTQSWVITGESEQRRLRQVWISPDYGVKDVKGRIWPYFVRQNLYQYGYWLGLIRR